MQNRRNERTVRRHLPRRAKTLRAYRSVGQLAAAVRLSETVSRADGAGDPGAAAFDRLRPGLPGGDCSTARYRHPPGSDSNALNMLAGTLIGIFLLQAVFSFVQSYLLAFIGERIVFDLRTSLYTPSCSSFRSIFTPRGASAIWSRGCPAM